MRLSAAKSASVPTNRTLALLGLSLKGFFFKVFIQSVLQFTREQSIIEP